MSAQQEYAEFPRYTVSYASMTNADIENNGRSFAVQATPQEIEQ